MINGNKQSYKKNSLFSIMTFIAYL